MQRISCIHLRNLLDNTLKIRFLLIKIHNAGAADSPYQHTKIISLCFKHLLDLGDDTNGVQLMKLRILIHKIFLGNEENILVALHGGFQSADRFLSAHIKMYSLVRIYRQPPKGQNRQSTADKFL